MIPIKLSEPEEQKHKRPELLTLLCVLTFIGSGLAAFSNLSISLAYSDIDEIIASSGFDIPGIDEALSAGRSFFVFSSILYFLSLIGAVNMWKLKKIGFHIYSISQIILLTLPSMYISKLGFPALAVLITSMFIILYAANLKYMN